MKTTIKIVTSCEAQQQTHENYVIGFSDGTVKVGTTGRGTKRITEVVRKKLKDSNCEGVISYFLSDLRTKKEAYRIERDTCYLMRNNAVPGTREWFMGAAQYVEQTVAMFSHNVGLKRKGRSL
ncbi:MAG: GIY-YIG nuclease family protein [Thiobacillus sp.]